MYIYGFKQYCYISSAKALGIAQSSAKSSIFGWQCKMFKKIWINITKPVSMYDIIIDAVVQDCGITITDAKVIP